MVTDDADRVSAGGAEVQAIGDAAPLDVSAPAFITAGGGEGAFWWPFRAAAVQVMQASGGADHPAQGRLVELQGAIPAGVWRVRPG